MADKHIKIGGTNLGDEKGKPSHWNDTFGSVIDQFISDAEMAVRVLQANDVFTNGPNLVVDEFVDSNGTNNTVNTGSSTASYDADLDYYTLTIGDITTTGSAGIWTDKVNAFDDDLDTFAICTSGHGDEILGRTFSATTIGDVDVTYEASYTDSITYNIKLQSYNGSSWTTESTLESAIVSVAKTTKTVSLSKSVQGLRVFFECNTVGGGTGDVSKLYDLDSDDLDSIFSSPSTVIVDANTATLDGNEKGFAISVPDSTFPTNTSMTVTVSDGTSSLSAATIDTISKGVVVGNPGTLSSGTLKLTFTLASTNAGVSPTIKNYGVKILR